MFFLRAVKLKLLRLVDVVGINDKVINSTWRQRRLLIICWHSISSADEHLWNPYLFVTPETFRSRLELLCAMNCNLLPLGEALSRVESGNLPPRAVALTFDDGDSSFYRYAWPMLKEFDFPATLYWTTYYSTHPLAVFDPMLLYLLWKGRERHLRLSEPAVDCSLSRATDRTRFFHHICDFSKKSAWTAERKEHFLEDVATALEVDYEDIKAKRILHLIDLNEARLMVAEGLDLQLHTHRHRVPRDSSRFSAELNDNIRVLHDAGMTNPSHFCYPSGSFKREYAGWLRDQGVRSATTCQSGLVHRNSNAYFLPRMIDHNNIGSAEFNSWLSGLAAGLSRRRPMDEHGFA